MPLTKVNVGSLANDHTGTKLRNAFQLVNLAIDQINLNTLDLIVKALIDNAVLTGLTTLEQLKVSTGGVTITAITSDGVNIHFWSGVTELAAIPGIGGATWGTISGSLPNQNDLTSALNAKQDASTAMTTSHAANGVTGQKIINWDLAFGWGNHASAGYALNSALANYALTSSLSGYVPVARTVNGHALSSNITLTLSDIDPTNLVYRPTYFYFASGNIRIGERGGNFVIDKVIGGTGFAGTEDVDWESIGGAI